MSEEQQDDFQIEEEESDNLNLKLALFLDKLTKEEVFKKLVILMRKNFKTDLKKKKLPQRKGEFQLQ